MVVPVGTMYYGVDGYYGYCGTMEGTTVVPTGTTVLYYRVLRTAYKVLRVLRYYKRVLCSTRGY